MHQQKSPGFHRGFSLHLQSSSLGLATAAESNGLDPTNEDTDNADHASDTRCHERSAGTVPALLVVDRIPPLVEGIERKHDGQRAATIQEGRTEIVQTLLRVVWIQAGAACGRLRLLLKIQRRFGVCTRKI